MLFHLPQVVSENSETGFGRLPVETGDSLCYPRHKTSRQPVSCIFRETIRIRFILEKEQILEYVLK